MTDIDKFKNLLNDLKVDYSYDSKEIEISNDCMIGYGMVAISFNKDGSFNGFIACD